jgi:hypothetical protein
VTSSQSKQLTAGGKSALARAMQISKCKMQNEGTDSSRQERADARIANLLRKRRPTVKMQNAELLLLCWRTKDRREKEAGYAGMIP